MKPILLIAFFILVASLAVSAQETIDLQVNGVGIGAKEPIVVQKLGKPSSRKKGGTVPCYAGDTLVTSRYPGLVLELTENLSGEFFVFTMSVTSPKWSVSGISIGANIDEVRKKFGESKLTREKGLDYLSYYITDGYANFVFKNKKLVKIEWELNLC